MAREQLVALEEQLAWSSKIIGSQYFANQTTEDQTRLKGQFADLEKQRDEAKKLLEETVDKLFKTGSWPIGAPSPAEDGVEEEKQKEVLTYIQELKDTALQMSKMLGDISKFKSPAPLFLSSGSDDGTAMDVDQPGDENAHRKSLKRRRISRNLDGHSGDSMPAQEELDEFLERLVRMEGLISTLENDINAHGRDARDEFELLVDAKLDEFQAAREEAERQRLEEEQRRMQDLEQETTITGEQVGELASEIGDLIMRVGKLEVDVGASRKGRQESFEKVLEVGFLSLLHPFLSEPLTDIFFFLCLFIGGTTFTRIHYDTRDQRSCHPNLRKGFERLHIPTSFSTRNSTNKFTTL